MHRLKHGILAACLVTGLAAVGACNKGPDPSDNATRALKNANLDDVKVDWDKDVREETMRAGGAGGQHVNKTESCVRIVHLATGLEVKCQNERSQHQNRAMARKMILARLARLEDEKREAEDAAKYKSRAKVGFGSQIRNYFLHPTQRVKDGRTGYLEHNFQNVLDGNLQGFLDSYLKWRVKGEMAGAVGDDE